MKHSRLTALALAAMLALGLGAHAGVAADTLYHDLGEQPGLVKIVDDATDLWLLDGRTKDTFDNINIERFKKLLVLQICELSGGPDCHYKGRDMYQSHKGLHLNTVHFNALVEDLQIAMDRSKVAYWTQNRLLALLAPMQRDIVTR